jgi:hypothetical protein
MLELDPRESLLELLDEQLAHLEGTMTKYSQSIAQFQDQILDLSVQAAETEAPLTLPAQPFGFAFLKGSSHGF